MSENKKPRLAEVLGVEVGEKFKIKGYFDGEFPFDEVVMFQLLEDGTYKTTPPRYKGSTAALLQSIDHPERVIHMSRWTEQEVEDAKALKRLLSKDDIVCVSRSTDGAAVYVIRLELYCGEELDKDTFPSLRSGETVALSDIIGGNDENQA